MGYPTRIYLTGFMGSGKSTIAPLLADALSYESVELDAVVEEIAGKPIPQIFADDGEKRFREIEWEAMGRTCQREHAVISLGGGALVQDGAADLLQEHGWIVYLQVPTKMLVDRLEGATNRPLLRDDQGRLLSREKLHGRIGRMLAEREPYYRQADLVVDAGEPSPQETVDAILAALEQSTAQG